MTQPENSHGEIKIFAGNGSKDLAKEICKKLNLNLGAMEVSTFSDGEINVNVMESVRGSDVFLIQSTSPPVNNNLMELLIMIDAMKRASAGRITAVIPYFGYARQDRKARARDPISAKLVANLIERAGCDRILTMDLHSSQIQGFFDIPVDNLYGIPVLTQYFKKNGFNSDNFIIVAPDVGSVARSRAMAKRFDTGLAIVDKRRPKANVMEVMNVIGDIEGKVCLMLDDMIDTAGTITQGAVGLIEHGAKEVYACCSHGVLSGPAIERIENSPLKKVVILDTIQQPAGKLSDKFVQVSVSDLFADAIKRVYGNESVSKLFD